MGGAGETLRGHHGALGSGAPVVSPAAFDLESLGLLLLAGWVVADLALGSPWGGGEVSNHPAGRPCALLQAQGLRLVRVSEQQAHGRCGLCVGVVRWL